MTKQSSAMDFSSTPTEARSELGNALIALGQALRRPDLQIDVSLGGILSRFPLLSPGTIPKPVEAEEGQPLQIEDKTAKKIRRIINGNVRRQSALYRNGLGIHLARNRKFKAWISQLIPLAVEAHEPKMNYLGLMIGDDILGPGRGMSSDYALEIAEKSVSLDQKTKKRMMESFHFNSVEQSYAFWSRDTGEPDSGLVVTSTDQLWKSKTRFETENLLEHLLHCVAFMNRKGEMMNQKVSTLCSGVSKNPEDKFHFERTPKVESVEGRLVIESSLNSAKVKYYSHRHVKRIYV